jgi:hypothetical protein
VQVAVVIPTCRSVNFPEQSLDKSKYKVYVVHDVEGHPVEAPRGVEVQHIIAPDRLMYGARCSCIRSAGFMQAYRDGATHILTMDDDVLPTVNWVEEHVQALDSGVHPWARTLEDSAFALRGEPIYARPLKVGVTHGLWSNVPDFGGATQVAHPNVRFHLHSEWKRIHPPFAQCSMNLGFRREVTPVMYQPFMGEGWPFKRHDDIWQGLLCQPILMRRGYAFLNGGAVVWHTRASNAQANMAAEVAGNEETERLWQHTFSPFLKIGADLDTCYINMAKHIEQYEPINEDNRPYFAQLAHNMRRWVEMLRA